MSPHDILGRFARAKGLLLASRDLLDERVDEGIPAWASRRGWAAPLLDLSDEEVAACEAEGLVARAAHIRGLPPSLVDLARSIEEATSLPRLTDSASAADFEARADDSPLAEGEPRAGGDATLAAERGIRARKVPQLAALLGAVEPMARGAGRIVDVGSGSGHFTRLAAEAFERETLGLERNPDRVAAAEARVLALEIAPGRSVLVRYALSTVGEGLSFEPGDLAVGLHACGALGDRLVAAAALAGCDVALVSCCLQKIDGEERLPLSAEGEGLLLRRETLGLSNLTSQPVGVEVSIERTMAARRARHALIHLLRARGERVRPGEEMRGINRRRAHHGLREIAERACSLRGLLPPTPLEIERFEREGAESFERARRLSLPRNMLSRLVEVTVVLDRAARLVETGHHALVATPFDRAVTPRNVALFATRTPARLPDASNDPLPSRTE
ncbi:MAG: methyltransferase [Polyangiaceae bacterium]